MTLVAIIVATRDPILRGVGMLKAPRIRGIEEVEDKISMTGLKSGYLKGLRSASQMGFKDHLFCMLLLILSTAQRKAWSSASIIPPKISNLFRF